MIQNERKMKKLGIDLKSRWHSAEAELFVDSSGISDSSTESSDENENWVLEDSARLIEDDDQDNNFVKNDDNGYQDDAGYHRYKSNHNYHNQ